MKCLLKNCVKEFSHSILSEFDGFHWRCRAYKEALSNLASPFDLAQTKPAAAGWLADCAALFQFACRALEICRKTARQFVII